MRQRGSRRFRPRPHSRTGDNMPDAVPHKEPTSPLVPPNDIIQKCINDDDNNVVDSTNGFDTANAILALAERRTQSERYIHKHNRFFFHFFSLIGL